ncbi:serine acetyltransferase 5 [Olea europaea subsp. europaea]|uniref:serine O-acetyltransferase n=1 Tax=Olea europaea subsp. europaea TaxID=158383 RepID=A0A8S0UGB3_OLEEU|nr:serine acetyltransferase 5 [Olea europaea subsp. europaea]
MQTSVLPPSPTCAPPAIVILPAYLFLTAFFITRISSLVRPIEWLTNSGLNLGGLLHDVFAVDIHPAAKIGKGILFDHATGVVVGETAVIGNNVSILHHVTLGGTGKVCGDRRPKIGDRVLIGAGATILGNIKIGEGAKIGPTKDDGSGKSG